MKERLIYFPLGWRKKHSDNKVWDKRREVGERNPKQLGVPAGSVAFARKASRECMLHAPGHLGEVWTAQDAHGKVLSFQILKGKKQRGVTEKIPYRPAVHKSPLPLTVIKVCGAVGVFGFLREAVPQPPQVSFDEIQPRNICLEETRLNDAHFDA